MPTFVGFFKMNQNSSGYYFKHCKEREEKSGRLARPCGRASNEVSILKRKEGEEQATASIIGGACIWIGVGSVQPCTIIERLHGRTISSIPGRIHARLASLNVRRCINLCESPHRYSIKRCDGRRDIVPINMDPEVLPDRTLRCEALISDKRHLHWA